MAQDLAVQRNLFLQSWTRAAVKKYRVQHRWSIDNLYSLFDDSVTTQTFLKSQHFGTNAYSFHLQFFPKWNSVPGFAIINVVITAKEKTFTDIKAITQHELSIIDKDGEYFNVNDKTGEHFDESVGYLFGYKIPIKRLLDPDFGLLPQDRLTIHCEVSFVGAQLVSAGSNGQGNEHLLDLAERQLVTDLTSLWHSGKMTDLCITFGVGQKELHAHKSILAARSPVFGAMFEHDTEEKKSNTIEMIDCSSEVFEVFLHYIYTAKVKHLDLHAEELLKLSDKYQVMSLKTLCENYLCTKLTPESVASLLLLGDSFNADKLRNAAFVFMQNNAKETIGMLFENKKYEQVVQLFRQLSIVAKNESDI